MVHIINVKGSSTLQPPPPKTWASLFRNKTAGPSTAGPATVVAGAVPLPAKKADPKELQKLGEILARYQAGNSPVSLLPRGMSNAGNCCYVNAILQALIACSLFHNMLVALLIPHQMRRGYSSTPLIDALVQLCSEYGTVAGNRQAAGIGPPLDGSAGVRVLRALRQFSGSQGARQEDAEEFLSCLLNSLQDEMLGAIQLSEPAEPTRRAAPRRTPLADIFRGRTRTRLHRAHRSASVTSQPFFTLQLDIQRSDSVKDALEHLAAKNYIEGVSGAWQRLSLEHLPAVLVLHLKCFQLDARGRSTKLVRSINYPIDLNINPRMLTSQHTNRQRQYKLFAVVYHEGAEVGKGHYLTDAFYGRAGWLRFDDERVTRVTLAQVLRPQSSRMPYLLMYRRQDTLMPLEG